MRERERVIQSTRQTDRQTEKHKAFKIGGKKPPVIGTLRFLIISFLYFNPLIFKWDNDGTPHAIFFFFF